MCAGVGSFFINIFCWLIDFSLGSEMSIVFFGLSCNVITIYFTTHKYFLSSHPHLSFPLPAPSLHPSLPPSFSFTRGFCVLCQAWNSVCRCLLPSNPQTSSCFCLPGAGIKGVHHHHAGILSYFLALVLLSPVVLHVAPHGRHYLRAPSPSPLCPQLKPVE